MCLNKIYKRAPKPNGKGWKVFSLVMEELKPVVYGGNKSYPVNKWVHRDDYHMFVTLPSDIGGFYIFKKKKTARLYARSTASDAHTLVVRKVEYRGAYQQGNYFSWHTPTVIATQMKIYGGKSIGTENE